MGALNRKLLRDLFRLRGQVIAIALVIGSGTALLTMSLSTQTSLRTTTDAFYDRAAFAEVFAGAKRAPERLAERIRTIPGVQAAETRIRSLATLDVAGMAEPIMGQLVSLPPEGLPLMNRLTLRSGRLPSPNRPDEVVLHEPFAESHRLGPGDSLRILMNGRLRTARVVGTALSPEFVYAIGPGMLVPDESRYGIIWMGRDALAAAYDLDGAFNDVTLSLLRGVDPEAVIDRLDDLLEPYGGDGAIARADQISNWFLMNELDQLGTMATILPAIFLSVAAFLTNTVLARLIAMERREISLLKAFGYSNYQIAAHYGGMALIIAAIGVALGFGVGLALGRYNTQVYSEMFRFPFLHFRLSGSELTISAGVSAGAALFGALFAIRRAIALPPAEAMQPPAPEVFRTAVLPPGLARRLDNPTRMILRQVLRTPIRSALTTFGTALAVAVLVMALQWPSVISHLVYSYYADTQRQHLTVGFFEPLAARARHALRHLPGVLDVEPMRLVPVDFAHGRASHRGSITGLPLDGRQQVIFDVRGWVVPTPRGGVVLGSALADKLGVDVGDRITANIRIGPRRQVELSVVGLFETNIGTPAMMNLDALNLAVDDDGAFEFANLVVDPAESERLYAALKAAPTVSAVLIKQSAIDKFHETVGETMLVFVSFFVAFACALAMGVAYNGARVAVSERGRELATLRVLGFTRREIAYILLGETALLTFLALPLGCVAGIGLIRLMNQAFETELFRVPFVLFPSAFGEAVLAVAIAVAASGLLVRRRLNRLDLIAVLKTRE